VIKCKLINIENFEPTKTDSILAQIKLMFLELNRNKNLSKQDILEFMVLWLHKKTNKSIGSCEIVVYFFIQNCEVF